MYRLYLTLLSVLLNATPAFAHLERFAPVPGEADYPRGLAISSRYRVLVKGANEATPWDARPHQTTTYKLWPDYVDPGTLPRKHAKTAVHVAQVDADVRVRVRVEVLDGTKIERLRLKPTRLQEMLASQESGSNWVEFEIDPYRLARYVLVEINAPDDDTDALQDGLMFFLNPPSVRPEGRVLALPAGVVGAESPWLDDRHCLRIDPDSPYDAIYLPADTVVDGRIDIRKPGFTVVGRGMIIGSRWPFVKTYPNWRDGYPPWLTDGGEIVKPLLSFKNSGPDEATGSRAEGVLVAHPYHFCVGWAYWNENLKTFGWRFSSDGIHGVHKRGSFMRVNDDATYVNEGSIEDCTYWGMVNGACFQFGWGLSRDNNNPVVVRRCDVVRGEWDNLRNPGQDGVGSPKDAPPPDPNHPSSNRAVWASTFRSAQAFTVRNKTFEDIRVDAQVNRLFYLGSRTEQVSFEDFVFRDIWFEKSPHYEDGVINVLWGKDFVRGFVFDNFVVEGKRIESLGDLEPLRQNKVQEVSFE